VIRSIKIQHITTTDDNYVNEQNNQLTNGKPIKSITMLAKLCAILLLSMAVGTVDGNIFYDDSLTFQSTIAATTGQKAFFAFTFDADVAVTGEFTIALPNFNKGTLAVAKTAGFCGSADVELCTTSTTGTAGNADFAVCFKIKTATLAAQTPCKIELQDLTIATEAAASDSSTYTVELSSPAVSAVAISRSDAVTIAALTHAATFSQQAVGTATDVTFTFQYGTDIVAADFIELVLPHFTGTPATVSTCDTTTWTLSVVASGATFGVKFLAATATLDANTECTIVVTGLTSPARANNFAANYRGITTGITISSTVVVTGAAVDSSDSIGVPSLYSIKSECRTGGVSTGSLKNCVETASCMTCSSGFVQVYGTSCTTGAQVRCDARVSAQTSVDIYFNPNGVSGTVTCGAFVEESTPDSTVSPLPPLDHISGLTTGTSIDDLYSRNSAVVSSANIDDDHVVTLNRLKTGTLYHVYCHSDDFKLSEYLDVHTLPNTFVTGISLAAATLTGGASPGTLTLKLTHGKALAVDNTIVMTTTRYSLFGSSADAVCSATSAGVSVALKSAVGAAKVLTVTMSATGSAAGSELVITCTGNLANNAAAGRSVRIASLAVSGHETVYGVPSYTTT
jgi:hypothetical protein